MDALNTLLSQITAAIMSIVMSLGLIVIPGTDEVITQIDPDAELCFVFGGDSQVSNYAVSREKAFISFCQDLDNAEADLDALVIAGDIAENGLQVEYDRTAQDLSGIDSGEFIVSIGNHDVRLRDYEQSKQRFLNFRNSLNDENHQTDSIWYKTEINGYKFLVMGSDEPKPEEASLSYEQMAWLNRELKASNGEPVFVILHQSLRDTHGLPETWGSPMDSAGSVGKQSDDIMEILDQYNNVFLLTGHLHTAFGEYSYFNFEGYEYNGKVCENNTIHGINAPSIGISSKDGRSDDVNKAGTGYYVEVSDDSITFYARDFENGKYVPSENITFEKDADGNFINPEANSGKWTYVVE